MEGRAGLKERGLRSTSSKQDAIYLKNGAVFPQDDARIRSPYLIKGHNFSQKIATFLLSGHQEGGTCASWQNAKISEKLHHFPRKKGFLTKKAPSLKGVRNVSQQKGISPKVRATFLLRRDFSLQEGIPYPRKTSFCSGWGTLEDRNHFLTKLEYGKLNGRRDRQPRNKSDTPTSVIIVYHGWFKQL